MLRVWGRRNSINVQKVMWLIGELRLPHEHLDAGGSFGGLDDPEFLKMNPHGHVPVIDDGGVVVWESHTIIRYLSAIHGRGSFWSDDEVERSLADRWMDWTLATLQHDFMDLFWDFYRTPTEKHNHARIKALISRCAQHFCIVDRHLANSPYLAGDSLTMGDIPTGTMLYRYFQLAIDRPTISNVAAWYDQLQQRPAYREHVMVPFGDLRGRLEY